MNATFEHLIQEQVSLGQLYFDHVIKEKLTLKVGGKTKIYFEPGSIEELSKVVQVCSQENVPYYLVGNGSNLLLKDNGYAGVLIRLTAGLFKKIMRKDFAVTCGAGLGLLDLIQYLKKEELSGGEFFTGIPGTVGGALRMNAGAHGESVADILKKVTVMLSDGTVVEKTREELECFYRQIPYLLDKVVLSATFQFESGTKECIQQKIRELNQKRAAVTPPHFSAGCIFKNPEENSAGKLIDQAGLKGLQVGKAKVSLEHGNYFVNLGGATSEDMLSLIKQVQQKVQDQFGILLETEIQIVGD